MRAAIYLRISQDVTGQGAGVSRQLEDCKALCDREGWEIAEVYTDNDVSAYKVRPGFRQMIADIETGLVDAIVAWQPDRLYRKFEDLQVLVEIIEKHEVAVHTVKVGDLNLGSAYGRMVARMLSVIAMGEGELKSERWRRSWRQGREAGRPAKTGSRLFGYTRDSEVIPEEADIARRMVADLLNGHSMTSIARWLNAEGIRSTRDNQWTTKAVKAYLTNPRLAAWSTLNGDIVAEGDWEPIIDRETWEQVRAMLTANTRPYIPRKSLLNGLIFCGLCGHRLVTSSSRGRRSYRCPNRPGMDGCGKPSGYADCIEDVVETYAKTRLDDPAVLARIAELRAQPSGAQAEVAELELRVKELEAQLDEPGVPVKTILRAIDRTRERQETLLATLAAAPHVTVPARGGQWPDDLRRRRALVDLVVERVDLDPAPLPHGQAFKPERVRITGR